MAQNPSNVCMRAQEPSPVKSPLALPKQYNTCFYLAGVLVRGHGKGGFRAIAVIIGLHLGVCFDARSLTGVSHNRTVYADLGPRLHKKAPEPDV